LKCQLIRVPREEGGPPEPYLERYRLLELPWGSKVYVHRFVDSDPERGYHNHPWDSLSFPLVGEYLEHVFHPAGERVARYGVGGYNRILQEKFHRVELTSPDAWTLFYRRGTANGWGFLFEDVAQGNTAWDNWISKPDVAGSRWVFSQHLRQPHEESGWAGIPLGREVSREPLGI